MKTVKLSECTKEGQLFLYEEEIVNLQYILRKIWEDELSLLEIRLIDNDEQLDNAISDILHQMYVDAKNGIDKESYELNHLNTTVVCVDIAKKDIIQVDDYNFQIR